MASDKLRAFAFIEACVLDRAGVNSSIIAKAFHLKHISGKRLMQSYNREYQNNLLYDDSMKLFVKSDLFKAEVLPAFNTSPVAFIGAIQTTCINDIFQKQKPSNKSKSKNLDELHNKLIQLNGFSDE